MDDLTPVKAFGLAVVLAGVNPKNLILTAGAAAGLAQLGVSTSEAVVALSRVRRRRQPHHRRPGALRTGRRRSRRVGALDSAKGWLSEHNAAVMAVLLLVFGIDLIAKGIPRLTS